LRKLFHQSTYTIDSIEFKTIGLREINILSDFPTTIIKNGYTITIPEPAVYIIQKILANPTRKPVSKRKKDIYSILNLLDHIEQDTYHNNRFKYIYGFLTQKQKETFKQVCESNHIKINILDDL